MKRILGQCYETLGRIRPLKSALTRLRTIRNGSPRGADLFHDLDQAFDIRNLPTVFDVGANVGQTARIYHREFVVSQIYSFEPVASSFSQLQQNTQHLRRVTPMNAGLGALDEQVSINLNPDSKTNSILHNQTEDTELIEVRTMDSITTELGLNRVDFLKIDTEGYELKVLEGSRRLLETQAISMIYLESEPISSNAHFVPFSQISEFLSPYGYQLFGIYEQQPNWKTGMEILYYNPLFVSGKRLEATSLV